MEYKDATDVIAGVRGWLDKLETRIVKSWVGRAFWHSVNVQWYTPPIWPARAWEVDEPFRRGRTVLLRYGWGKSAVLGFWGKTEYDEADALLNATIHGRQRTDDERAGYDTDEAYDLADPNTKAFSSAFLHGRSELRARATSDVGFDGQ